MSILDRKVLPQDQPQYEELSRKARESKAKDDEAKYNAEVERVRKENERIEKENIDAEKKYQADLAEYNRQIAEAEKKVNKYDVEIEKLIAEKGKALNDAHYAVFGPGGSGNRSDLSTTQNSIIRNYDMAINKVVEQKRVVAGYEQFSALYPNQPIPRSVQKSFLGSPGTSIGSIAEKYYEGKAAKAEYDRQTSMQRARTAPSYTPQQTKVIEAGFSGFRGTPTQEMLNRDVRKTEIPKATVFPFTPSVAQDKDQVRGLINVKTVETIYGGKQIETNPRAFVKGLERNIPQPGTPIRENQLVLTPGLTQTGMIRVSNLNEWNGQQTGKVRVSDPKIDRMIGFYGYEKTNEIIRNYNRIAESNNLLIKQENRKNKIEFYKYRRQQVRDDPYFKSPKAQGPPKPQEVVFIPNPLTPNQKGFDLIYETKKSFGDYFEEINPQSKINQDKYKSRSGLAEPIETLDVALIASPGGKILGGYKLLERGIPKLRPLLKPIEQKAQKILVGETSSMLDIGKITLKKKQPFSYEIPYKPTKRANEINVSGGGEIIGKFSNIKSKPVAATQKDVKIFVQNKPTPVKIDPYYKPRGRYEGGFKDLLKDEGEVVGPRSLLSKNPIPKQSDVRLPILKKSESVKTDPFYKPTKRANEIDLTRDDILVDFTTTKIRLGKGRSKPNDFLKGKQDKPVEEDYFYKPTKRANEIDYKDVSGDPKVIRKEELKSEVQLGLKRELKRIKRLQPEFKSEKINLGGEGQYLAGKSGKQQLLQIQKSEQVTKKKLLTKRQAPVNINWSEKIETANVPQTGSAPILTIPILLKEKKKKAYLQEQQSAVQVYDIPLSAQRPQIKTMSSTRIMQVQSTPQKTIEKIKYSTVQPQKISSPQRLKTPQRYIEMTRFGTPQMVTQTPKLTQKQPQKLTQPTPLKFPTRQTITAKLNQPLRLTPKYDRPRPPPKPPITIGETPPKDNKRKEIKRTYQPGDKADFLGNVSETSIIGIYNRIETTYGQRRINRLLAGDKRVDRGGKRAASRRTKPFVEGKGKDPFGFKYEAKKKKSFKLSL